MIENSELPIIAHYPTAFSSIVLYSFTGGVSRFFPGYSCFWFLVTSDAYSAVGLQYVATEIIIAHIIFETLFHIVGSNRNTLPSKLRGIIRDIL